MNSDAGRLTVSFRPLFLGGLLPNRARFRFAGRASARPASILAQSMPVNLSSFFLSHPWGAQCRGRGRPFGATFCDGDVLRLASGAYFWLPYSRWSCPTTSRTVRPPLMLMAQVPPTPWLISRNTPSRCIFFFRARSAWSTLLSRTRTCTVALLRNCKPIWRAAAAARLRQYLALSRDAVKAARQCFTLTPCRHILTSWLS